MDEINRVKAILENPLLKEGYTLYSVKLLKKKEGLTLEVIVDRDDPISLEDIVKVSDLINPLLDKEDPISSPYTLDVSSLGGEKPIDISCLEHYEGRYVHLHLANPYNGANDLEGDIKNVSPEEISLEISLKGRKKVIVLKRQDIDKARLAIKF